MALAGTYALKELALPEPRFLCTACGLEVVRSTHHDGPVWLHMPPAGLNSIALPTTLASHPRRFDVREV